MAEPTNSLLEQLRAFDAQRPAIPGEHWFAFGVGLYLLTRRPRTAIGQLATVIAAGACIARSVTGRDGLIAALERPADAGAQPG